jgi:hypothetical protein
MCAMTMSSSIQIQQDKQPTQLKLDPPQTKLPPLPSLPVSPRSLSSQPLYPRTTATSASSAPASPALLPVRRPWSRNSPGRTILFPFRPRPDRACPRSRLVRGRLRRPVPRTQTTLSANVPYSATRRHTTWRDIAR